MNLLPRPFSAVLTFFLLSFPAGCSNGATNSSAPVIPPIVAATPKAKFVYTGNQGKSLSGYSVDISSGELTPLSGFPLSDGLNPTILAHDPQNRFLLVADNAAFALHVFAIDPTTGALNEVSPSPYTTKIQPGYMAIDPSGTHVYLYRTGANVQFPGVTGNQIVAYNLSASGTLTEVTGSPFFTGSSGTTASTGLITDSAGKYLYLQDISNLYAFSIDGSSGALTLIQTLGSSYGGGLALDPVGTYLYAAGSNAILVYAINPATVILTLAKSSPTAKLAGAYTISISPNGKYAYTIENNNYLVSYSVQDGVFVPVGTVYSGIYGLHIAVDPSSSFVYVPQACSNCPSGVYNIIHEFAIGSSGGLTPLAVATIAAGTTPFGITVISQ